MRKIEASELIINGDGSVFHLHLLPEQLADRVILVGDPARVDRIAAHFETTECTVQNREFHTVTGVYHGVRLSVVSTGIGTDNIDIVMNELDALVNVDFATRTVKSELRTLHIVRLGTSGAIQHDIELGTMILSQISIGFDGLLNFYEGRDRVSRPDIEHRFTEFVNWNPIFAKPYFVESSQKLNALFADFTLPGMTISAPGFYAPQGRYVRLKPSTPENFNRRLAEFRYENLRITNYEMESSAIAALAKLMGHEATTICVAIAQRTDGNSNADYGSFVDKMIIKCLDKMIYF